MRSDFSIIIGRLWSIYLPLIFRYVKQFVTFYPPQASSMALNEG